jgi:ectoine hydroxylase-related dioxygenase (phytanoyl-CoA dioxygenase family)
MKRYSIAILRVLKRRPRCGGGDATKSPGGPDAAGAKRSEEASGGEAPPSKRLERSRAATPLEAFLDLGGIRRDMRREDFERDGFVVEDALYPAAVERLTAAVERVRRAECPNGDALHRLAFLGLDDAFLDLVDHPAVLPLVCDALGWNVYVYHCHLDVHPPLPAAAKPQWRWHQDGGRQNVELSSPRPRLSLKVAWFLTDVPTADHGALRLVPGSHTRESLPRDREPPDAVPLLVRAGSAVVLDRRLWHARAATTAPTRRAASSSTPTRTAGSGRGTSSGSTRRAWRPSTRFAASSSAGARARSATGSPPTRTCRSEKR